ncbi:MAG: diguanylate cyclase [Leptolyngbya sp. SIO3F4]|nr:diguanylate cyclase [Leptolyngbya sp. SIO3F4]
MNLASEATYTSEHAPLVLIVDDDAVSNLMLAQVLRQDGYRVFSVDNGQAALTACQRELPDIILMDAIMPIMNGFECCQELRAAYGLNCPPILMITGLNDSESVECAYDAGAVDYVPKPFHWAVLRGRVRWTISAHIDHQKLQQTLSKERLLRQELRLLNQKLHRLATIDGLTGISNRRVFNETLSNEWKRLRREEGSLGLVMIDIDSFKAYNDHYGHLEGDNCLCQVAQVIQTCIRRPADLVARYGGEEFAFILPHTDLEGVFHVGKKVQEQLQARAIPHAASKIKPWVTASIGVAATTPTPPISSQALINWADQALYEAKNKGRNQVVAYTDDGVRYANSFEEATTSVAS